MRTCNHCGDTFPDFDVAHVCSKGQYAPKLPAPNLRKAAQDVVDAFTAPSSGFTSPWMGRLNAAFDALRAALQQPAPDDAVCEWTRYIGGGTTISCKPAHFWFLSDTNDWRFCQNCGKRIRFIDAAMQQEQSNGAKPVA